MLSAVSLRAWSASVDALTASSGRAGRLSLAAFAWFEPVDEFLERRRRTGIVVVGVVADDSDGRR